MIYKLNTKNIDLIYKLNTKIIDLIDKLNTKIIDLILLTEDYSPVPARLPFIGSTGIEAAASDGTFGWVFKFVAISLFPPFSIFVLVI